MTFLSLEGHQKGKQLQISHRAELPGILYLASRKYYLKSGFLVSLAP